MYIHKAVRSYLIVLNYFFCLKIDDIWFLHCINLLQLEITPQSCLDYLKRGFKSDGYYIIYDFKTDDMLLQFTVI
jgi:hypothetical protein